MVGAQRRRRATKPGANCSRTNSLDRVRQSTRAPAREAGGTAHTPPPPNRIGRVGCTMANPDSGTGVKCGQCGRTLLRVGTPCPDCGRRDDEEDPAWVKLVPGQSFDRYRVVQHLATGGMGSVYRVFDPVLNRDVAMKVIPAGFLDAERAARFVDEAALAARIEHPNVIRIYDVGIVDEVPFYTMDLVEGVTFADEIGVLGLAAIVSILRDVARALGAAHRQGIVHRDVKPTNIYIRQDGQALLGDFGIARLGKGGADLDGRAGAGGGEVWQTLANTQLGTPQYMSPEQVGGKREEIGPAADVWALGVLLYEVLAGQPPFRGDTVEELFEAIVACKPLPPGGFPYPTHVDPDLETIAMKCLARDPKARPAHADLVADALDGWLATQGSA